MKVVEGRGSRAVDGIDGVQEVDVGSVRVW